MAVYTISICWYDVSSVSPLMGYPLSPSIKLGHCQSSYDTRGAAHFATPQRFHLTDFFTLRHPVGGALFHPHLPEIKVFQLFVGLFPLSVGSCVVYVCVFVVVLIVLLF